MAPLDRQEELVAAAEHDGVTLVLGAGVGLSHGVPDWDQLVQGLWERTFPRRPMPPPNAFPQLWPLALEIIARELGGQGFTAALRSALYGPLQRPGTAQLASATDTLSSLVRALVREWQKGPSRRVHRIITFNVDDLLEEAVWTFSGEQRVLQPIIRGSQHPEQGQPDSPLPVYHLHGFLPERPRVPWNFEAPDLLIFTDAQFWSTVYEPFSFPNRVMSFALHDSRCVFVGVSMTDINVLRWLATRALEIEGDASLSGSESGSARAALCRHFWVRPDADDPTGFLSGCLDIRGVQSVRIRDWAGPDLSALLERCFPAQPGSSAASRRKSMKPLGS